MTRPDFGTASRPVRAVRALAVFLLACAALPALAQAQTEIWSATVTPGSFSGLAGYWDMDTDVGTITDKDFTYDGVTYSVLHIRVASGGLQLS